MNFGRQRVCWTYSQCLATLFNSNHSRTTFLLIVSYFLVHLCVMNLWVQTLKKDKTMHSKEKMEICSNLGWKYSTLLIADGALVSDGCLYHNKHIPECILTLWVHQDFAILRWSKWSHIMNKPGSKFDLTYKSYGVRDGSKLVFKFVYADYFLLEIMTFAVNETKNKNGVTMRLCTR